MLSLEPGQISNESELTICLLQALALDTESLNLNEIENWFK